MNNLSPNENPAAGPAKMPAALCEAGLFYLVAVDKEGYLTFTNAYFLNHFFFGHQAMDKKNILDLIHPADRNHFKDVVGKCLSEARPQSAEIRVVNGACHRTEWEISYLEGLPGNVERFLCIGYRKDEPSANQDSGF